MASLIGRELDLATVAEHVSDHGQITVLGPGGVGKTSLALAIAADREHLFVDLSGIVETDGVPEMVAGRLGFGSVEGLIEFLADRSQLVVLDTCEHVLDGAAELTQLIIDGAPASTVLATSRMPLDIPGEFVFVLRPLALPTAGGEISAAVELFLTRARSAGSSRIDPEEAALLCSRLDGMPLAIELAAARARSMTPSEIVAHLDRSVDVLSRRTFRGQSRHRSMRAAIEWSYNLLEPVEQDFLRSLTVFPGHFDAELAHAVCGGEAGNELETADLLAGLIDRSLLSAEAGSDGTRFRLLDTIRAYGEQRIIDPGEAADLRDTYIAEVTNLALGYVTKGSEKWGADLLSSILALADDLLHATRSAMADETSDRAYLLMTVLWAVVHQSRNAEIAELGRAVLANWPDDENPLWADAAATTATALREWGEHEESLALATDALTRTEGAMFADITLNRLLALHWRTADHDLAAKHCERAISAAESVGMVPFVRELRVLQAQILGHSGRVEDALVLTRGVIAETEPADVNHIWALIVEAMLLFADELDQAAQTLENAHRLSVAGPYPFGIGASNRLLAIVELKRGRFRHSAERLLKALDHNLAAGNDGELGVTLLTASAVLDEVGHSSAEALGATALDWKTHPLLLGVELTELVVPDTSLARAMPARSAVQAAREALMGLAAGDEPSARDHRSTTSSDDRGGGIAPQPAASQQPMGDATARGQVDASIHRQGDGWAVTFGGRTASVRHAKAMDDIVRLLAAPGREIHVLDLTGAGLVESAADEVIDAASIANYRQRLIELEAELDEADAAADIARSERVQSEIDVLIDQLSAAYGVGGRVRRTTGTAERARSTVTQRVRSTIKKLHSSHPEFARHLHASITTGTYCKYQPEQELLWEF